MRWLISFATALALSPVLSSNVQGADQGALKGYPEAVPEDVSFETVVGSQPFPAMKYAVPIVGTKVHPEEVHVTPAGALVLPRIGSTRGLYLAALLGEESAPLSMPPADRVKSKLVDGYLPGVENTWELAGITLKQLAFAIQNDGGFESRTGSEALITLVRYTLTNTAQATKRATLALQFGDVAGGHDLRQLPAVYPDVLSFQQSRVRHSDGRVGAALLTRDMQATFKTLPAETLGDRTRHLLLNASEQSVQGPEYTIDIERKADVVRIGDWQSPKGADLYMESSRTHSVPIAVEIQVAGADGKRISLGTFYRNNFTNEVGPAEDYLAPGQHSAALNWAALSKVLPEGHSHLIAHGYYLAGDRRQDVAIWQPLLHFAEPGTKPRFQNQFLDATDENRLSITLTLAAGESKSVELAVPYEPLALSAAGYLDRIDMTERLSAFRAYWQRELNQHAEFIVPEVRIRDGYRTCLANNLLSTDRDPKTLTLMPHPDGTMYEATWSGDSGVIIQAMDRAGYHQEAESMLDYFLSRQGRRKPDGDVQSVEGFFSGDSDQRWMNENGFILWAMSEHYKLTRDETWLRRVAAQLVKGCDWIVRERARNKTLENGEKPRHYGLLPKGKPSDLDGWDYWYWTDTYSYMGLRGVADVLADADMKDDAARFAAEADDYKACIVSSVERSTDQTQKPPFVPPTPYRTGPPSADFFNQTWYSICSPIYMVEAGLLDARSEAAGNIDCWLEKCGLFSGMPAFGSQSIDPYYVYNQSLTQILRGEAAKSAWTLYSISAYAMGPGTYATIEGHNLVTGFNSPAWDANRQPHMHSSSRYIDLVRIALLLEEGQDLHLLAGTPRGWLADGQHIEVKRAPSYFGEINFSADSHLQSNEVRFHIDAPQRTANVLLHVRPPTRAGRLQEVSVNGKAWKDFQGDVVKLGRLNQPLDVVCRLTNEVAR